MAQQSVRITQNTLQIRVALHKVLELFPLLSNSIDKNTTKSDEGGEQMPVALSDNVTTGDFYCHFDRTGRFVRATAPSLTIRRGLDNRLLLISIDTTHIEDLKWFGRRRRYYDLSNAEKSHFYEVVYSQALTVLGQEQEGAVSGHGSASPQQEEPITGHGSAIRQQDEHASISKVSRMSVLKPAPSGEWAGWQKLIEQWTPAALAKDEEDFARTYKPISILPPDQYKTLVIQVAEGCSYNQCLFCDFYRDRRFHVKSPVELAAHLDAVKAFFGPRLQDRTGIFLGDGNALVVSADRLQVAIRQIRAAFESEPGATATAVHTDPLAASTDNWADATTDLSHLTSSFATFMDTFNLDKKSVDALHTLRDAGIDTVYVGLESGYDPIRSFLKKPGPASEALAAIRTLKKAGYTVGPIVMIGVGDARDADAHFEHTARLLQEADLTPGDKIFLSPFVQPSHGEYRDAAEDVGIIPYTQDQIEREMMRWKDVLGRVTSAKVTGYYVREHVY
jgi:hypothetical protein